MDGIKMAIADLRVYEKRKAAVGNLEERIKILNEQYVSLRGLSNSAPVMGGANRQEDAWINNIAERGQLETNLKIVKSLVGLTEKGLASLTDAQRLILELFFINRAQGYKEILCDRLCIEQSRLYELKDRAIKDFVIGMYGIVEL